MWAAARQVRNKVASTCFKTKTRGALTVATLIGGAAYAYDSEDKEKFTTAIRVFRKDQEHLKSDVKEQFTSIEELLKTAEALPTGHIPNPEGDAYTPSRSQELVVQGFTGGILTLFQHPDKHEGLVQSCGLALQNHYEDIGEMGQKYHSDRDLATAALSQPKEILEQRAKELGKSTEEYTAMLQERFQHADQGIKVSAVLYKDIQYRLKVHQDMVALYPEARKALEKLMSTDPAELAKITKLPESECRKILTAGIGSAMYGIGLITGQTVAGLCGQVIKNEHLGSIVDVAKKLGTHALDLVQMAEKLNDTQLTSEERDKLSMQIQNKYAHNIANMRRDEGALIMHSVLDRELSQALAHLLAMVQGPQRLYGGANTARLVGGAVPLTTKDIDNLHSSLPYCINDKHGQSKDIAHVPGAIERSLITAMKGDQPWLLKENEQCGLSLAFRDAKGDAKARFYEEFPVTRPSYGSGSESGN